MLRPVYLGDARSHSFYTRSKGNAMSTLLVYISRLAASQEQISPS